MANKNEIVKLTDGVYQIKYYWLGIANVYAYLIVGSERALLIDTCYSITGIKKYVEQITTLPVDVVNTHGHFDHIGGNAEFETIYLSKADREVAGEHSDYNALRKMIDNYEEKNVLVRYLFKLKKYKKQVEDSLHIKSVEYKDLPLCGFFNLGERKVSFIETPGHTPGGMCIYIESANILFSGDTLFCQSIGRTDFPGGSFRALADSVHSKLFVLPDETRVLPGHMGSTTIGFEKENNPFV